MLWPEVMGQSSLCCMHVWLLSFFFCAHILWQSPIRAQIFQARGLHRQHGCSVAESCLPLA